MFCSKCGKEIEQDMQFCIHCGNKVSFPSSTEHRENKVNLSSSTKKSNSKVNKIVKIELIVFLSVIVISVIVALSSSVKQKDISKENFNANSSIETEEEKQSASNILTLDDVKLETYTSIDQMNEATQRVAGIGWIYITERPYKAYPNAKWTKIRIGAKDNYGRFLVHYTYITSEYSSEATEIESIYVWVKDINDFNKMGYYYSPIRPSDWGKPFADEVYNSTEIISKENLEKTPANYEDNYVGIGIYMLENTTYNKVEIISVIKDSPAEKAGIKSGDLILKVDEIEYTADDKDNIANKLKGQEGTTVTMEILRDTSILNFEITREKINLSVLEWYNMNI